MIVNMDSFSDQEIFEIASPIWENMSVNSNAGNYARFSKDFSDDLKRLITEERLMTQSKEFPLLTSLVLEATPIGCIRRVDGVCVLFRQLSSELPGEFLGKLKLINYNGTYKVSDAQVY